MPFLFGLLAALGIGAYAMKARGEERREIELLRAAVPFAGLLTLGMTVTLTARQRTIEGEAPPRAFRVQIVGVPDSGVSTYTGVLLGPLAPMRGGDMIQFGADKVSNVVVP